MQSYSDPRLAPLRDVAGVLGSFAFDRAGELMASDLPVVFDTELLREAGPRILRLEETLASDGAGPRSVVLRFSDQRIHIRFFAEGALGVLTTHDVNAAMLKMALTLTGRRLDAGPARGSVPPPWDGSSAGPRGEHAPETRRSASLAPASVPPEHREPGRGTNEPRPHEGAQAVLYRGRRLQSPR